MMDATTVIFYILAALILGSGMLAVSTRKIFRAAIYLLFSLTGIAGLYFWMQYEFLAAVQIIVYVGGIVVLIIFSIFLTQTSGMDMPAALKSRKLFAALAVICGFLLTATQISQHGFVGSGIQAADTGVRAIGHAMLNTGEGGFALPFEVVSILLLSAMIGCIVIAIKNPERS
ncbi:MAG: NADH-quinone oxidoreductase subunit J [Bacteroidetes bacterium]|nr:MAG: NADH-quinone oxidoreductase subunit J [Bacteroidota bacterium]